MSAQVPRAPELGGRTFSLGQPRRWRWEAGMGGGAYFEGPGSELMVRADAGGYYAPLNPVANMAELGLESYLGIRGDKLDAGFRGLLRVPYLGAGIGADYSATGGRVDMLITLRSPVRRGGVFRRGTMLRLDWYPMLSHSFTLGVSMPLGDPLAGRTRPIRDHVVVASHFDVPARHRAPDAGLAVELMATLDSLRASAEWIRRETVPFLDQDARDSRTAMARTTTYLQELESQLAKRSAEDEVRFFHAQLERAFTLAASDSALGAQLAQRSRRIILDEVLLPYNRLLGRKKTHDHVTELGVAARGRFAGEVAALRLSPAAIGQVLYVVQVYTEILELTRHTAAREWDDPRLAWLPLQYALLPEDHDEQRELDSLVERATGVRFTDHNRVSYVANVQFHQELLRMIHRTRDYHVLWIHDFPAVTNGQLDSASFAQVVDGYLAALAERVEAYDAMGTLPSFFIFLDEHYYEQRQSRLLMNILENPLDASSNLEHATAADRARLERALVRLRIAVHGSRVLMAEAREYGDGWLHNRIKVHVNITNRPDASFWGGGLVSSVFGYPDDVMRDHRKISFRDVREDDPYGGEAILTGMGVGQAYIGPGWDDRALVLGGPVLFDLKRAARDLLLTQGLTDADLPVPLRSRPEAAATPPDGNGGPGAGHFDARAMAVVNETGYLPKSLNVVKAMLYSLMPPGSVFKVPDSLWNSPFYAALLVGACLRGSHALVIAPAQPNAPSNGFPQMVRAHELLSRLLLVRRVLGPAITAAGGDLRTGLYALPVDTNGFASRAARWARQVAQPSFLDSLLPFSPALAPLVADWGRDLGSDSGVAAREPRLHQKVQFMATVSLWRAVMASPEWPRFMATYLRYRAATYTPTVVYGTALVLSDSLEQIAEAILGRVHEDPRAASYAIVGSQNQDYRGMFMDGEVGVVFTGAESLVPLMDLVFMVGTVTWVDDQATLDRLLPPTGELRRRIARVTKDGV